MVRGEAEPVALLAAAFCECCVCPLTRCRLVSGLERAVGVFPAACSNTAVPVVSALAFVLEYPETLWHQPRTLYDATATCLEQCLEQVYGSSAECAVPAKSPMNTACLLCMGKRSRSTTIENGVRLLISLRRCSCTSNLQLFSIHAGFYDPAFFVPAFGTGS